MKMQVASTCVWHVAMQATCMQAARFELPTRFAICMELSPCLEPFSMSSVVPLFSVLHGFITDSCRQGDRFLLCIDDASGGAYIGTNVRGFAFSSRCTRETRHILLMHCVPLCHRELG